MVRDEWGNEDEIIDDDWENESSEVEFVDEEGEKVVLNTSALSF